KHEDTIRAIRNAVEPFGGRVDSYLRDDYSHTGKLNAGEVEFSYAVRLEHREIVKIDDLDDAVNLGSGDRLKSIDEQIAELNQKVLALQSQAAVLRRQAANSDKSSY